MFNRIAQVASGSKKQTDSVFQKIDNSVKFLVGAMDVKSSKAVTEIKDHIDDSTKQMIQELKKSNDDLKSFIRTLLENKK